MEIEIHDGVTDLGDGGRYPNSDAIPGRLELDPAFQIVELMRMFASLIGKFTSIEAAQTASRRQGGPLIQIRVKDVMKLSGTL